MEARCRELKGEPFELPEDGYQGEDVREIARELLADYPDLLEWEPEARRAFLRREAPDRVVAQQKADLERYRVRFDRWFRERDLHEAGRWTRWSSATRNGGCATRRTGPSGWPPAASATRRTGC